MLWHFKNEIDGFFSRLEQTRMETPVKVLRPFEGAARELSAETAQLSQVFPPAPTLGVVDAWLLSSPPPVKSSNKESYLLPKHLEEKKNMVYTI